MKYLLLLLLSLSALNASSFIWKVSKNGVSLYLGGTIHVLKQSDYPLPLEFDEAYNASDVLVLEVDIKESQSEAFGQLLLKYVMYEEGKSLRDDLSPKVYMQLKKRAVELGLDMNMMDRFKVSMIVMSLTMVELEKMGMNVEGVDAYYANKADEDVRKNLYLESVEDQIQLLAHMGEGSEDALVLQTLEDISELAKAMDEIKESWRRGDEASLYDLIGKEFALEFPKLYDEVALNRNRNWLPQIEQMFETKEVELILVGSMHLAGPDGLLDLLRKRGYKIEQL